MRGSNNFPEFFDMDSLVYHEIIPPGQSVTGYFYVQVLQRLRDAVRRKRHYKCQGQWFLHHDNALSHTSLVVQQFLAEKNIPVNTQPLYSLDLTLIDFWLFPTLKMVLKEGMFHYHGGHQIESDGQTTEDSKRSLSADASNNGRIDGAGEQGSYFGDD
jgi:hypothetical protein